MNTHRIQLNSYSPATSSTPLYLGTAGSHGNEQLKIICGKGWENLVIQVIFHPCQVAVLLPADGLLDVPWEATAVPLSTCEGRIVFQGFNQNRLVNSTDLKYTVSGHSITAGRSEKNYTPGIVEGVLNQMAVDKANILTAADTASQANKEAAASALSAQASACQAASQAANIQTALTQVVASAADAASYATSAGETLGQVQFTVQQAIQQLENAEASTLESIAAAAPALPSISTNAAWQSVTVKPDGTGYNLAALAPIQTTIQPTVTGNPAVCENSVAWGLQGLKIYGKSIQDGTPSPENPIPIVSAGDVGNVAVNIGSPNIYDKNTAIWASNGGASNAKKTDTGIYFETPSAGYAVGMYTSKGFYTKPKTVWFSADVTVNSTQFSHLIIGTSDGLISSSEFTPNQKKHIHLKTSFAPSGAFVFYINANQSGIIVSVENIMVSAADIDGSFDCQYQLFTVSAPNGLPGIPVENGGNYTDTDGQQWICDEIDFNHGLYIQNIKRLTSADLLTKKFGSVSDQWIYIDSITDIKTFQTWKNYYVGAALCSHFSLITESFPPTAAGSFGIWAAFYNEELGYRLAFSWNGVDHFKTFLEQNDITLFYATSHPVKISLSAKELDAYRALTTYNGTTVVSAAEPMAGLKVQYIANGTKYLQSVTDRIAALEDKIK